MLVSSRSRIGMNSYSSEMMLSKKMSKKYGKNRNKKKHLTISLLISTLIVLLISTPVTLFSATATIYEPSLNSILSDLGFTNIILTDVQTFLPGMYNITLMAEFASYNTQNELSYYAVGTSDFQMLFSGPEGVTEASGGFIVPPIFKYFECNNQFGLSMLAPDHRYYTEHYLNPDYTEIHTKVYENLDAPGSYLIGFENRFGGYDRDYNDMVFSLIPISPPKIVSVSMFPDDPSYDQSIIVSAQVTKGNFDIESVFLSYQRESEIWTNVTMSLDAGLYVADIPAQPYETTVNYKVYTTDQIGFSDVSEVYSFEVGDTVPPVIFSVHTPIYPRPNKSVKVLATVTEPPEASGVKNSTLWYITNTVWSSLKMTQQNGKWTANIPGQTVGTTVEYYIKTFDNAENNAESSIVSYTHIPNWAPIANFSALPSTVFTGETINFDGSASYDLDGYTVGYGWDFGDGTNDSGIITSHSYADNGEYFVTLTVVDNEGAKSSKTSSVTVKNRSPEAQFIVSATILDKQETVTFDASDSHDPDGLVVKYSWDFGDGNTANGVRVSHSYNNVGAYIVKLTVTDNDGAKDLASATKTVRNHSPLAVITETIKTIYVGDTITFNAAQSYDQDGFIVSYEWDFGDGTIATGITVTHTYEDNEVYTVTLKVVDNDGATHSTNIKKTVINKKPVAVFSKTTGTVKVGEAIMFDASGSYDPDGVIVNYIWDFGNGNTGSGVTIQRDYPENGTFTVNLTVIDDDGETDTSSTTIMVTAMNRAPLASFSESAEIVSTSESIRFDASESYDPDGAIATYAWKFGDGNTAASVAADHKYKDDGVYTVTLTITDNLGTKDSVEAIITVLNRAPVASFIESTDKIAENEIIYFDASGSYDLDGMIVNYAWDFGDGNIGNGVTTEHVYIEEGIYTVNLTVTDDDADSASVTIDKTIETLESVTLAVLSVIGLGIAALTATFLYGLYIRRKNKKKEKSFSQAYSEAYSRL